MCPKKYYNGIEINFGDKIIYARFLEPHLVLSTCQVSGGLRRDLEFVLNHQICAVADHRNHPALQDPHAYRQMICEAHNLSADKCAMMGTAAKMGHVAVVSKKFRELEVVAVVTGGVGGNAGRAGDPATVLEKENGFEELPSVAKTPSFGTINIMLFCSAPLSDSALTRTVITVTEAKTVALQELAVNSRYSDGLATGTGTDQIIVASPRREGFRLKWAGKHVKLGELIGLAVIAAVKETLAKQNNLTPHGQCSAKIHLERFGCSHASMRDGIANFLTARQAEIFVAEFAGIIREPTLVAAVVGLVHLRDKFIWNILPDSHWAEIISTAAAQVAGAVSGRYELLAEYRSQLQPKTKTSTGVNKEFLDLCWQAIALGFADVVSE